MASIRINGREINNFGEPYIVAEIGANHLGDYRRAYNLMCIAANAGANAVKFQLYAPIDMTLPCSTPDFSLPGNGQWGGMTLWDLYSQAQTSRRWMQELIDDAKCLGLDFILSVFNPDDVPFAASLNVDAVKVASFELPYTQLLAALRDIDVPKILSCGMATRDEVKTARAILDGHDVALLKCTSAYPADVNDARLGAIPVMIFTHGCPVGLSDHTLSPAVPPTAVALGACIIEKHLTLQRSDGGLDAVFSLEPGEFAAMVSASKDARAAIGSRPDSPRPDSPVDAEQPMRSLRRSLYVTSPVSAGELFTTENVRAIRPGYGLPPAMLPDVLGKVSTGDIERATPLTEGMFNESGISQ